MTKDIVDRLTEYEPEAPSQRSDGKRGCMVVRPRATCSEEIEQREADYLAQQHFPIPFWSTDEGGREWVLEPLMTGDFKLLAAAGITPEEWEIAVLEDHLEQRKRK